jgi:hypothetical protein
VPGSKTLRQCSLSNVTDRGATVTSESPLPDSFDLFISLDATSCRRCQVMSRSGLEVNVAFANDN